MEPCEPSNSELWSLAGVALGFLLAEGSTWARSRFRRKTLKAAAFAELQVIESMIADKRNILQQAVASLLAGNFMPTQAPRFPHFAYETLIIEAPSALTTAERYALHLIHERLTVVDNAMNSSEERFHAFTASRSELHAADAVRSGLVDLEESLLKTAAMVNAFRNGSSEKIFAGQRLDA